MHAISFAFCEKFLYNKYVKNKGNTKGGKNIMIDIVKCMKLDISRKIDSVGRISIPKKLRDKFRIEEGDDCPFFLFTADDKRQYLAFELVPADSRKTPEELEILIEGFKTYGLEVPKELLAQLSEARKKYKV